MSERIDLTQFEGLGDWEVVPQPDGEYAIVTGRDNSSLEEANTIAKLPTLIAELKRCYDLIDKFHFMYGDSFEESFWIATCKPDGEGQCSVTINSYEILMQMVAANVVEIPEYSHDHTELILLECECGVTHEEWLESKN